MVAKRKKEKKVSETTKKKTSVKCDLSVREMIDRVPKKEFLSTKEVCYVFNNCHPQSVYRYVQNGHLTPYTQWGRKSHYKREDVIDFIKKRASPQPK